MRRAIVVLVMVAVVAVVLGPDHAPVAAQDQDRVRVVHLTVDSLHPAEVDATTPVLDMLKQTGTWYDEARAIMGAETLPNHVAMATGAYGGPNGITGNAGRLESGDTGEADPDLGLPTARKTRSLFQAIETACPDLHTIGVFSKQYVWRTFSEDPVDVYFDEPTFNIPESDHAPDITTSSFILEQIAAGDFDYLFANLGDVDRSGHVDATSILGEFADVVNPDLLGETDASVLRRAVLQHTDALLGTIVTALQASGMWDDTVFIISSDHSMVWSNELDPARYSDVQGALDADPATTGKFFTSENGGTGNVYLIDPAVPEADELLLAARQILTGVPGVIEALYREPNPLEPGEDLATAHPDWHVEETPTAGEIFVHVDGDHVVGTMTSNPLPGNHGHGVTRHATALISGGWDGVVPQQVAASDPAAVDPVDDTAALAEQAEQVDYAPTIGWLLGIPDPGTDAPQWQGRVLTEGFSRQPDPICVEPVSAAPPVTADLTAPSTTSAPPMVGDLPATGRDLRVVLGLGLLGTIVAAGIRRRPT